MARIGIIGTGWGARTQAPAFRFAGLEIGGIAGSDPDKTRRVAEDLGVPAFEDWRVLARAPEIDLVTIVTPPSEHASMALAALEAGKHVLSEKPTALDAREARRMVEAAARRPDQLALIDHELRFLPSWRAACERVREIGPIRYAEVRYSSPGRADRTRPWNWWSDARLGGGVWGAVGSHFVDAVRYLVGEVEAVQALLHTFIAERGSLGLPARRAVEEADRGGGAPRSGQLPGWGLRDRHRAPRARAFRSAGRRGPPGPCPGRDLRRRPCATAGPRRRAAFARSWRCLGGDRLTL
jgi:predicted dehydrogenase